MKLLICGLAIVFVLLPIDGKQYFRCDYTYSRQARGYLKFQEIPANWEEARLRCHLEGANIASPLNDDLRQAIERIVNKNCEGCSIFTGIHAIFSRGDFTAVEGIPLSKIPHSWAKDEPDAFHDSESCTLLLPESKLADVKCSDPFPYVCYKKGNNLQMNACGTIDSEYNLDTRTGSCYKFHKYPKTWSRAYMTCQAEGGHLAIINSDVEATVIRELFAKYPAGSMHGSHWKDVAFVGFHDWNEHGEFLTVNGETLTEAGYSKFAGGQPDNSTDGEFCGGIFRSAELNDLWCERRVAFICEKDPDSLSCTNESEKERTEN